MNVLTVCQPHAHMLMLPESDPEYKRIENRVWATSYRGPLLIHAGVSTSWFESGEYNIDEIELVYGAIIGCCELVQCVDERYADQFITKNPQYSWITRHKHRAGPFYWIVENCIRALKPYPIKGKQRIWNLPGDEAVDFMANYMPQFHLPKDVN